MGIYYSPEAKGYCYVFVNHDGSYSVVAEFKEPPVSPAPADCRLQVLRECVVTLDRHSAHLVSEEWVTQGRGLIGGPLESACEM